MEENSQIKVLESQIRECFGRVVWTHKTQEKCADITLYYHNIIKFIQISLSALTTTGVLISVFGESKPTGIVTAIFSAILFGINAYVKGNDLGKIAQQHSDAAANLWDIREKYLSLIADIKSQQISPKEIIITRDKLQKRLFSIYKGIPRTTNKAYAKASNALKSNEELTFSDEEINNFLPKELKKTKNN